jgi:hypothetical protein
MTESGKLDAHEIAFVGLDSQEAVRTDNVVSFRMESHEVSKRQAIASQLRTKVPLCLPFGLHVQHRVADHLVPIVEPFDLGDDTG